VGILLLLGAWVLLAGSRKPAVSSGASDPTKVRPMDPAIPIGHQSPIPGVVIPQLPDLDGNLERLIYRPTTPTTTQFDPPQSGIVAQQVIPGTTRAQTILVNRRGEILGTTPPPIPIGTYTTDDKGRLMKWDGVRWNEK